MTIDALILSPWISHDDCTLDPPCNHPALIGDYVCLRFADALPSDHNAANIPPDPNLVPVHVQMDDAVFAEIEADPTYLVLWDVPNPLPPDGIPGAAEFGRHVAFFGRAGLNPSEFAQLFGGSVNGRTRAQLAAEYTAWLATGPRGTGKPMTRYAPSGAPLVSVAGREIPAYTTDIGRAADLGKAIYNAAMRLFKKQGR